MTTKNTDISRFRSTLRQFERAVNSLNKDCCAQVSMAQCHVLLQIHAEQSSNTTDLARVLNLDASTVSRTVDSLVKMRLVEREEDRRDRRFNVLRVTVDGDKLCRQINSSADERFARVIDTIPSKTREAVLKDFELLAEAFVRINRQIEQSSPCSTCSTT